MVAFKTLIAVRSVDFLVSTRLETENKTSGSESGILNLLTKDI